MKWVYEMMRLSFTNIRGGMFLGGEVEHIP